MDFSRQPIILRKPVAPPATASPLSSISTATFRSTTQSSTRRISSLANLRALSDAQPLRVNRLSRARSVYWSRHNMSEAEEKSGDAKLEQTHTSDNAPAELSAVVDELLNGLSSKFTSVSAEILTKIDDMSRRLDNLEVTIQASSEPSE